MERQYSLYGSNTKTDAQLQAQIEAMTADFAQRLTGIVMQQAQTPAPAPAEEENSDGVTLKSIVLSLAEEQRQDVVAEAVAYLKHLTAEMQTDEQDGLENIWDEICVQEQTGDNIYLELYDDAVSRALVRSITALPAYMIDALQYSVTRDPATLGSYDTDDIVNELKADVYALAEKDRSLNVRMYIAERYS